MSPPSILLTGSTGFIGRRLLAALGISYQLEAPDRCRLDLKDGVAVRNFLIEKQFDVVIHSANPTGHNPADRPERLFEESLTVFANLASCSGLYGRMLYFGSGAEFGKHRSLDLVSEENFGQELPREPYGLSRYWMNIWARTSTNITNLRLFGCYGQDDAPHKLVPDLLRQAAGGRELVLKHDVKFDFLFADDLVPVLIYFIENEPRHRDYNVTTGRPVLLSELAIELKHRLAADLRIKIDGSGSGLNYSGTNHRLKQEIPSWQPRSLSEGLAAIDGIKKLY